MNSTDTPATTARVYGLQVTKGHWLYTLIYRGAIYKACAPAKPTKLPYMTLLDVAYSGPLYCPEWGKLISPKDYPQHPGLAAIFTAIP